MEERKPLYFRIRDEIEEIIKENNIDRKRFHEYSKRNYLQIIKKFYFSFCDYQNYIPHIYLNHSNMHLREELDRECIAGFLQSDSWEAYLEKLRNAAGTPAEECFLILCQGWVYEGFPEEIFRVLTETDGWLQDFIILPKKSDWCIIHDYIAECAFLYRKRRKQHS